ncbi:MAG: ATP-binding protein [Candidatus Dormibacteria bacterium]
MRSYEWKPQSDFLNRRRDLAQLDAWWSHSTRDALALVGRRRVGKSWLLRQFAHGKPAIILVADEVLITTQMARFADELESHIGVRPSLPDVPTLIRVLYQLGREGKFLAIIDEFPLLLPDRREERRGVLSEIQAVMENHRDESQTKLVLCGSLVGQMEALLHAQSPLHGRLRQLDIWPMTFAESSAFTDPSDTAAQGIERFAVVGGMARYLSELGHGPLREVVCANVLDRSGPLFNDPRVVLEQELRNPATYFSLLEELAGNPALTEHLTNKLQTSSSALAPYLDRLREMRLVTSSKPVGATDRSRTHKYRVSDGLVRFWFRFVFPNQEGLQSGLRAADLWDADIAPFLAEFVASSYEELCIRYTRIAYGREAPTVGSWWGPALDKHRRNKDRFTEEIDVAAAQRRNLRIVGECKWTAGPMTPSVLDDLRTYKIPALAQDKNLRVPASGPKIVLFARSGFDPALQAEADSDKNVILVDLDSLVSVVSAEGN